MAKGHRSQVKKQRNIDSKDKRPQATAKYVGIPASKAKIVLDQIVGKDARTAAALLQYNPRLAATIIGKVLKSAMANAENNHEMNPDALYVAEISANKGPTMKRFMPGSQGRASIILKRTSHVGVTLKER